MDDPPEGASPPVAAAGVPRSSGKIMGLFMNSTPNARHSRSIDYLERAAIFFAAFPGLPRGGGKAWYTLFAHAPNFPSAVSAHLYRGTTYGILRNLVAQWTCPTRT